MLLTKKIASIFLLLMTLQTAFAANDENETPQTSFDGLELASNTDLKIIYLQPGADLSKYKRIALLDSVIEFKKNWRRDLNRKAVGINERVTKSDEAELKGQLGQAFLETFNDELFSKHDFISSDFTAADVMVLEASVVNIDIITVHDGSPIGMLNYSAYTGQMTLLLEIYDSLSGAIVARIIDQQAVRADSTYRVGNKMTTAAESDIIFRNWAILVADYLSSAASKGS